MASKSKGKPKAEKVHASSTSHLIPASAKSVQQGDSASAKLVQQRADYSHLGRQLTLVPMYVLEDYVDDVRAFLNSLGHPAVTVSPPVRYQGSAPAHQPAVVVSDDSDSDGYPMPDPQLVDVFDTLSISGDYYLPTANSTPIRRPHSSNSASSSQPTSSLTESQITAASPDIDLFSTSLEERKYYTVIVGKVIGVFYEEWRNIIPVVHKVSDFRVKMFHTHLAADDYLKKAEILNLTRVVRNPDDDLGKLPKPLSRLPPPQRK